MSDPPVILLDLDGTLTDPAEGITTCIRHGMEGVGVTPPPASELTWCIGPPLQRSLIDLVGADRADDALRIYRERFTEAGLFENRVYDGIPALLAALRSAGRDVRLCTSKPHVYATRIVDHFGLRPHFTALHGSELDGTRTDKTELIAHALQGERNAIMVGDRRHDIVGAKANEIRSVGVLWGYGDRDELTQADPDHLVETPEELRALLLGT